MNYNEIILNNQLKKLVKFKNTYEPGKVISPAHKTSGSLSDSLGTNRENIVSQTNYQVHPQND